MLPSWAHGVVFPGSQFLWPDSQMLCDSPCWKYDMLTLLIGWGDVHSCGFLFESWRKSDRKKWSGKAANVTYESMKKHAFYLTPEKWRLLGLAEYIWSAHLLWNIFGQQIQAGLKCWISNFSSQLRIWNGHKTSKLCSAKLHSSISTRPGWPRGARCVSALISTEVRFVIQFQALSISLIMQEV